jgi:hypothetical protein
VRSEHSETVMVFTSGPRSIATDAAKDTKTTALFVILVTVSYCCREANWIKTESVG